MKKENCFAPQSILIEGNETGFFKLNLSAGNDLRYTILTEDKTGNLYNIAQTEKINVTEWRKILVGDDADVEIDDLIIRNIFKKLRCSVCCWEETSAIKATQTEIGIICSYCWRRMERRTPWKPLDNLQEYILDEYRMRN